MTRTTKLLLVLICATAVPAYADKVYVWVDAQGVTHFSQTQPSAPDAVSPVITHALQPPPAPGQAPDLEPIWQTAKALEQSRLAQERLRAQRAEQAAQQAAAQARAEAAAQQAQRDTSTVVTHVHPHPYPYYRGHHNAHVHGGVKVRRGDVAGYLNFSHGRHYYRGHRGHGSRHTGIVGPKLEPKAPVPRARVNVKP